ncbi:MAG: radical SAM protein [Actinomycetota bacterium]|nr:radical SAM protein [Actinomycetota bacterium]
MSERPEMSVVLVGMSWPGYRSLALGYVRAYAQADSRLAGRVGFVTIESDSEADPWWIAYRVLEMQPDVVGFSVTCYNARAVWDAASIIASARPDTRIVLGGPEMAGIATETLVANPGVTAIVRGEGEATFAELLYAFLTDRPLWPVEGVSSRKADGTIISAPDRALITDMDTIPSPYLTGVTEAVDGSGYIETYRGCPHACAYCYEGKGYGRLRTFSRERVEAEVAHFAGTPTVHSMSFIDPVFNLSAERLAWLAELMAPHAARGLRLHTIEVDIERIDSEAAVLLVKAGVATVETGPQTIGSAALSACRRGFDRERFIAGVRACREAGISVECDLIVGLPGDTENEFLGGLEFVLSCDPGKIQFSTLHVLPGTELWERAEELGLKYNRTAPHEIISTPDMDFGALRRAEVFGSAVTRAYSARLAPATAPGIGGGS